MLREEWGRRASCHFLEDESPAGLGQLRLDSHRSGTATAHSEPELGRPLFCKRHSSQETEQALAGQPGPHSPCWR